MELTVNYGSNSDLLVSLCPACGFKHGQDLWLLYHNEKPARSFCEPMDRTILHVAGHWVQAAWAAYL